MIARSFVLTLGMATGIWMAAASAQATLILSSSGTPDENRSNFNGTVGTRFQTGASSLKVTALGFEDTGFSSSHQVGLWTDAGALVASTTVVGTDTLMSQWRFATLGPPVILAPNTVYRLGGETISGGDPFTDSYDSEGGDSIINFGLNAPLITMGTVSNYFSHGAFSFPASNAGNDAFRWAPANAVFEVVVPEPSTLLLTALGVLGFGLYGWRKRRK